MENDTLWVQSGQETDGTDVPTKFVFRLGLKIFKTAIIANDFSWSHVQYLVHREAGQC